MNDDMGALRARGEGESVGQVEVANYVAELTAELAKLSRQHRLDALAFILDMARLEAENSPRFINGRR
jgi:hypothetical protein